MKIEELEAIVEERTPQYASLLHPDYDEKLMVAHYMLAEAYNGTDWIKAHEHFREAVSQFGRMCRQKQTIREAIVPSDFKAIIARYVQDERDMHSCSQSLLQLGKEIGADIETLLEIVNPSGYKGLFSYLPKNAELPDDLVLRSPEGQIPFFEKDRSARFPKEMNPLKEYIAKHMEFENKRKLELFNPVKEYLISEEIKKDIRAAGDAVSARLQLKFPSLDTAAVVLEAEDNGNGFEDTDGDALFYGKRGIETMNDKLRRALYEVVNKEIKKKK